MNPLRRISEMVGRIKPQSGFMKMFNSFWGTNVTVDYARSDYKLFRAIYYAAIFDKKGAEYILGAGFAKPIINATTAFTIGQGFTVAFDGAEKGTPIQAAQDDTNQWIKEHIDDFYNLLRYGLREGDGFMVMHDDLSIEFLEPDTVVVVYDPTNGGVLGYDVTETVETNPNTKEMTTFRRYYRRNSFKVTKQVAGGAEITIVERVFTDEGIVDMTLFDEATRKTFSGFEEGELVDVPLPVFHFANEIEPKAVYGISDLQNTLVYFQGYSKILQEATKSNIYNSTPIPVISGDKNDGLLEQDKTKKNITWGRNMVLYLKGDNAKAEFMNVPQTMGDTGKLLEYYFYLIVQASETPEFIFGTAIQGSKASAQEQMPIMVKKATRKQAQLKRVLRMVIDCYIWKKYAQGDQNFYAVFSSKTGFNISFPPIVDEDKQLTLETIKTLVENGILSDRTALEIANLDQISDIDKELEEARKDAERRDSRLAILPDNESRVINELDNLDDPLNNPPNPDEE